MEVLLILLLGGGIAFCWWRIEQLERRLGEMGERLAQLTDGAWREGPAEVSEPAETPSPQPAKRIEKEVAAQDEPEPELAPEPEPATEPAERALADPGETQSADASEPDAPAPSKGFTSTTTLKEIV